MCIWVFYVGLTHSWQSAVSLEYIHVIYQQSVMFLSFVLWLSISYLPHTFKKLFQTVLLVLRQDSYSNIISDPMISLHLTRSHISLSFWTDSSITVSYGWKGHAHSLFNTAAQSSETGWTGLSLRADHASCYNFEPHSSRKKCALYLNSNTIFIYVLPQNIRVIILFWCKTVIFYIQLSIL